MNCANCEADLTGEFCAHCGQSAKSRRGPIWRVAAEFFEEIFAPNSKLLKSLAILLVRPGLLSKQFLDGKRASVLPPIRMYLVVSLLFFVVFSIPQMDVSESNIYIGDVLLGHDKPIEGKEKIQFFSIESDDSAASKWFEYFFADKRKTMQEGNPQVIVDRITNKLEGFLPNALIFFVPLFALMLKILYMFKRILYFDHLIFTLHFQTWLMGAILLIYGLTNINSNWAWLFLLIPVYLAKAQKVVYQQSYWLVIPKTFAILIIYIIILTLVTLASMLGAIAMM